MKNHFIDPNDIFDQLALRPDMAVAEFGCGSGSFTVSLAKRLNEGIAYGLDIQKPPLSAFKSRTLLENINNVRIINCDLEEPRGSTLPDTSVDIVFIPNMLFQVEDKDAIITEAKRILKKEGRLVIIDWLPESVPGPEERVSPQEVKEISEEIGFEFKKNLKAGKYHFALLFEKD